MNCNQGDMALIVSSAAGESGSIVTCVSLAGTKKFTSHHDDLWRVDKPIKWLTLDGDTIERLYVPDSCLKPIRPQGDLDDIAIYLRPVSEQKKSIEEQTI